MKAALLASLESHIQDWADVESRGFDWPLANCSESLVANMAKAAALVVESVEAEHNYVAIKADSD